MESAPATKAVARPPGIGSNPPTFMVVCLNILAILCGLAGLIAAAGSLGLASIHGWTPDPVVVAFRAAALLLGGALAGAILWAVAWALRRQYEMVLLQRQMSAAQRAAVLERAAARPTEPPAGAAALGMSPQQAHLLQEIASQLAQINANSMLSPQQMELKRKQWQTTKAQELRHAADQHLLAGNLDLAEHAVRQLLSDVPDYAEATQLLDRMTRARAAALRADVHAQTLKVEDFMAAGNFPQAEQLAAQLARKYPDVKEAMGLADRVRREAEAFALERRRLMYAEITRFAEARQWRSALGSARKFLEAYPASQEAELIRAQMATLSDNAQIEEVRQLRDQIRDLINRRKFPQAVDMAHDVVQRFPKTAVAEELRQQMEKLEEKAKLVTEGKEA